MTTSTRPAMMSWLTPYLYVRDADKALAFYQDAFGFETKEKIPGPDGKTVHAEMKYKGEVIVMFGPEGGCGSTAKAPTSSGVESPVALYIYCDDVDKLHQQAVNAGAKSTMAPQETFWGDRMCKLICPDGHAWNFATHTGIMAEQPSK